MGGREKVSRTLCLVASVPTMKCLYSCALFIFLFISCGKYPPPTHIDKRVRSKGRRTTTALNASTMNMFRWKSKDDGERATTWCIANLAGRFLIMSVVTGLDDNLFVSSKIPCLLKKSAATLNWRRRLFPIDDDDEKSAERHFLFFYLSLDLFWDKGNSIKWDRLLFRLPPPVKSELLLFCFPFHIYAFKFRRRCERTRLAFNHSAGRLFLFIL